MHVGYTEHGDFRGVRPPALDFFLKGWCGRTNCKTASEGAAEMITSPTTGRSRRWVCGSAQRSPEAPRFRTEQLKHAASPGCGSFLSFLPNMRAEMYWEASGKKGNDWALESKEETKKPKHGTQMHKENETRMGKSNTGHEAKGN